MMKRYLNESELESLSKEDYRFLLSEQFETHRRLREQAQSIIRMVIAGVGVIVALIGYRLYPEFQLPSRTLNIAGGAVQFNGILESMAENSLFTAAILATATFGLLLSAVTKSIDVLAGDGPIPLSRHKTIETEVSIDFSDGANGKMVEWILANDTRLVEAERQVEQSFTHIWAALGLGFTAALLTIAALLGSLRMIGLIHTALVVIGSLVAIYYLKDAVLTLVRTALETGLRSGFTAAGDVYFDTHFHRGVGPTMKIAFILFYGVYFRYSLNISYVWLSLFVI
jgi:hypothetical protein